MQKIEVYNDQNVVTFIQMKRHIIISILILVSGFEREFFSTLSCIRPHINQSALNRSHSTNVRKPTLVREVARFEEVPAKKAYEIRY